MCFSSRFRESVFLKNHDFFHSVVIHNNRISYMLNAAIALPINHIDCVKWVQRPIFALVKLEQQCIHIW
ncbi:hypothetical protein JCM19298_3124 [Nonlabens ulvanivorans]|nr:hypothetical protein JCM19298_3124 [Nonlabens ulvanivorans]